MLPQRNPKKYYRDLMVSYNIPELMKGKVRFSARRIADELRHSPGIDISVGDTVDAKTFPSP